MKLFRIYSPLPVSTAPLVEGEIPLRQNLGMAGSLHVMAHRMVGDNIFMCSIWDEIDHAHYKIELTRNQVTDLYKNDGIDIVWVDK